MFFVHGTPGSRLVRYPSLDDPEWLGQRRLRFIGVDRPGYGYSGPWPFRLDEIIGAGVHIHHGEHDVLVPAHHARHLAEGIAGSRLQLYPGEGHFSADRHIKEIVETLLTT